MNFGFEKTNEFLLPLLCSILPEIVEHYDLIDAKSNLQEITQSQGFKPEYRLVSEEGPPHNKLFTAAVLLNGEVVGQGSGRTLKEAQNRAAGFAINQLKS